MEIITETEAQILATARFILHRTIPERLERAFDQHLVGEREEVALKPSDVRNIGRVGAVVEQAEGAVFTALNWLSSYVDDKTAEAYVHARRDPASLETPFGGLPPDAEPVRADDQTGPYPPGEAPGQ